MKKFFVSILALVVIPFSVAAQGENAAPTNVTISAGAFMGTISPGPVVTVPAGTTLVSLEWGSTNATSCAIVGTPVNVGNGNNLATSNTSPSSFVVDARNNNTYTLTCTNAYGSSSDSLTVVISATSSSSSSQASSSSSSSVSSSVSSSSSSSSVSSSVSSFSSSSSSSVSSISSSSSSSSSSQSNTSSSSSSSTQSSVSHSSSSLSSAVSSSASSHSSVSSSSSSSSVQKVDRFQESTCTRVMKWFRNSTAVLDRLNARLQKRFGFTCKK